VKNEFQNVYVTLADGRVGMFSGPVFVTESDKNIEVKQVAFSLPKPLPDGMTWEQLRTSISMDKIEDEFNSPT
jgi:hypothetical protein